MFRRRRIPYDRAITVFSPDGRLLQVEYALETVKRGSRVLRAKLRKGLSGQVIGTELIIR